MRCPNLDGVVVEHEDKKYATEKIVNRVAGYINDCKNSNREVILKPNPEVVPPDVIKSIDMNSM